MKLINEFREYYLGQSPRNRAMIFSIIVILTFSFYSTFFEVSKITSGLVLGLVVSLLLYAAFQAKTQPITVHKKRTKQKTGAPQVKNNESFNESMAILQSLAEQLLKEPTGQTKTAQKSMMPTLNCSIVLSRTQQQSYIIPQITESGSIDETSVINASRFLKKSGQQVKVLIPKGNLSQMYVTQAQYAKWDSTSSAPALDFPAHILNLN